MAFAAANLWQESKCRGKATEILVRLATVAKGDLAAAMMITFFLLQTDFTGLLYSATP